MQSRGSNRRPRISPVAAFAIVVLVGATVVAGRGLIVFERAGRADSRPLSGPTLAVRTPTPRPTATPPDVAPQMTALAAGLPARSVSVAAQNLDTGVAFTFGSMSGQTTGSIVKLDIIETLLLQHQDSDTPLTDDEDGNATLMIEDSDNDAATDLYIAVGAADGLTAANQTLGVPCTVPGGDDYWGLTTTCAQGQTRLLDQLESAASPLDTSSQAYILNLMENVLGSQQWGVPVTADRGTSFAVKDGWLNLEGDTDWAINSDGIVTHHGQRLLLSVLSQNNSTMAAGVTLDQKLARLAAKSVTT
ncbi:MAG: serine hydrolase [Candidatus Dormibacteraceae bacterium]